MALGRYAAQLVRLGLKGSRFMTHHLGRLARSLDSGFDSTRQADAVVRSTRRHDMLQDGDEVFYAEQYWTLIARHLQDSGVRDGSYALDLGCGQGRLTRVLATHLDGPLSVIVGVDISPAAVAVARSTVPDLAAASLRYEESDLLPFLESHPASSVDVVLFTEVQFMHPAPDAVRAGIARVLRPGGWAFLTFRPRHYYLMAAVGSGDWGSVPQILGSSSGNPLGSDARLNWADLDQATDIVKDEMGLSVIAAYGVGTLSGIAYDPLSLIAQPSLLSPRQRELLMQAEIDLARKVPGAGRYTLLVARKDPSS